MGAWQALPDDLPPEVRHFVEQLRQLKDRTGLSLVTLGARTAYSKSSWQRYLNATQPAPRQAVLALCRVAGVAKEEADRFVVRWELAVQAWPRTATVPAKGEGEGTAGDAGSAHGAGRSGPGRAGSAGAAGKAEGVEGAGEEYEDDPTLPWWDAPPERPGPPSRRLLVVAGVLVVVLVLTAVAGALAWG